MAPRISRRPQPRQQSIASLISRLYDRVHAPLLEAVPRLCEAAQRLGDAPHEQELRDELLQLWGQLEVHLRQEAHQVFPRILSGRGASMRTVLHGFRVDNEELRLSMDRIANLTDGYSPSNGSQAAFFAGLQWLDERIRELASIENALLYPRVLAGEEPYAPQRPRSAEAWSRVAIR